MPEQIPLNFEGEKRLPPPSEPSESSEHSEGGYSFAERDECPTCKNPLESEAYCVECRNNKVKAAYLEKLRTPEKPN